MSIWKQPVTVELVNNTETNTMVDHLGIEILEIGPDFIRAKMPVDERTRQPYGILHGGASVVLAESLGSMGSAFCIENIGEFVPVGLEINANHVRSVREGFVYGIARPMHLGRTTHIWEIRIESEEEKLVCISRLTVAIVPTNR
ncbi:MAG: hotdog fold thioesterase [Bacteroidota bacterium]